MDSRQVHNTTSHGSSSKKSQDFWQKMSFIGRPVAYIAAFLLAVVLIAFLAAFCIVKLYPQEISQELSKFLEEQTGMELEFSGIDMTLLPLPALSLADVHVDHEDFTLDVAYATLRPSLLPLLQGKFSLGDISLWRPDFILHPPTMLAPVTPIATDTKDTKGTNVTKLEDKPATTAKTTKKTAATAPKQVTPKQITPDEHWGKVVHGLIQQSMQHIPPFLYGSSLEILHGSVLLQQEGWSLHCDSLQTSVTLGSLGKIEGTIQFDVAHIMAGATPLAKVEAFALQLDGDVEEYLAASVQSKGQVQGLVDALSLDFSVRYTLKEGLAHTLSTVLSSKETTSSPLPQTLQGQWKLQSQLLWQGAPIAVQSSGSVAGNLQDTIFIKDVKAQLEQDSLALEAAMYLQDMENPRLEGHIQVQQLSLPQWFGFARHLPPGIQHALHGIKGDLDFVITQKGLTVPRLQAEAASAAFTGKGGVPTWSKAVVFLDIHAPQLDLGKVYPEAEGKRPKGLTFAHKPLTPEPGTPEAAVLEGDDYISVDYDINVGADKVFAWQLPLEGFKFRVNPAGLDGEKLAAKHKNAAVLAFSAKKFFGGQASGKALLYRNSDDESAYDITALLRNVQAEKPVARLIGRELFSGRMSADATVSGKGVYAGEFLVSLGGKASLKVENGNFYGRSKQKVPFKRMLVDANVQGQNPAKISGAQWPPKLMYAGQWKAALDTEDISATSSWKGALEFIDEDYGTVALHSIPGSVQITFSPELTTLPHATEVHFDTLLSLNTTKGTVALTKATGTVPSLAHMQASGFGEMNFSKDIRWTGTVNASTKAISNVLAHLDESGRPLLPSTAPQSATLSANLSYAQELLKLDKVQMQLQDMRVSGSLQRTFTANPVWGFDLFANVFDFDLLFRDKKAREAAKAAKAKQLAAQKREAQKQTLSAGDAPVRKPLPPLVSPNAAPASVERALSWRWLENFTAKGTVRVGTYKMNGVEVKDVHAPVKIGSSILECAPIKATMYGGPAVMNFKGTVKNAVLQTQAGAQVKGVNLLRLCEDLQMETVIAGKADFSLSAQGAIRTVNDIPAGFDGTWRLNVGSGFIQSRDEKGKFTGSPTKISYFRDMGVITRGVLESHKFELKGDDLSATGRGRVNFVNDTLDMRLVVNTSGLSDIPVRFHGPLDNPERDVDTGAVLLSALGSLGMGVFDLIGGVFGAIFGLFK